MVVVVIVVAVDFVLPLLLLLLLLLPASGVSKDAIQATLSHPPSPLQ